MVLMELQTYSHCYLSCPHCLFNHLYYYLWFIIYWSRRIYAWARTKHFGCRSVCLS